MNSAEVVSGISAATLGIVLASLLAYSMTVPGLMLYFAGMVRRKNVLSAMMICLTLTLVMSIVWVGWAAGLALREGRLVGRPGFFAMPIQSEANAGDPLAVHLFFGAAFVFATCLIAGALVERMRLLAMLSFSVLWGTLVCSPLFHWTLRADGILGSGWFGQTIDAAGAQAIHISAGVSALVSALLVGRRLGYGMDDMRPHNLTYTTVGTAVIWLGAIGFHFGMSLVRDVGGAAVAAVLFTHLAMAGGAISWAAIEWFQRRRPSVLGIVSGVVAGFAGAAAGSGELHIGLGLPIGALAGAAALAACGPLKGLFKYDDSLDVFGVHAVGGAVGLVVGACFASASQQTAMIGIGSRFLGAAIGLSLTVGYSAIVSWVILKALDWTIGLRVPQESEMRGLDRSQHGQEGYIFN